MAKGLDKQKNEKKKGKTLKEKRAAKKEKKKQFLFLKMSYLVQLFNYLTIKLALLFSPGTFF